MLFWEIIAIYSENHTKPINMFRWKNADLLHFEAGGTCKLPLCSEKSSRKSNSCYKLFWAKESVAIVPARQSNRSYHKKNP
jgi:hypothetical protein